LALTGRDKVDAHENNTSPAKAAIGETRHRKDAPGCGINLSASGQVVPSSREGALNREGNRNRAPAEAFMRIKPIFAWYDLWIGAFWDGKKRRLYLFPVPCFGLVIEFLYEQIERKR